MNRMCSLLFALAISAGWATFTAEIADAVCSIPTTRVCEDFFASSNVLVGTVTREETIPPGAEIFEEWKYELRVEKIYRGPARKTVTIYTENDSGRYPLKVGETYLLFAFNDRGRLMISGCQQNKQFAQAREFIQQIQEIKKAAKSATGGEIDGRLVLGRLGDTGVGGITISAQSAGKEYAAVTDKDGWFHIQVPAGKYKVTIKTSEYLIQTYELSSFQPDNVVIFNGSCAQLLLFAVDQ